MALSETKRRMYLAAKALIRDRIRRAGEWVYYAQPSTCLYGPNGGLSYYFWPRDICREFDLIGADGREYTAREALTQLAQEVGRRHGRFVEHVNNWQPTGREFAFLDNSIEVEEMNRFGETRRVMTVAPHGDACF